MSAFEYLAVLVSLIFGLGITHILAGVGRTIHRRAEIRIDLVHFSRPTARGSSALVSLTA